MLRGCIREDQRAQLAAIERAIGLQIKGPELVNDGIEPCRARLRERMGKGVGVDNGRAQLGEEIGDRGFSAADAAGEADAKAITASLLVQPSQIGLSQILPPTARR